MYSCMGSKEKGVFKTKEVIWLQDLDFGVLCE